MNLKELYHIEWLDARGCNAEWVHMEDLHSSLATVHSVGWVHKETDEYIHLVSHFGADPDQGCGDMVIPKSCIVKKRRLK
jgi:hypothetical protein